MTTVEKVAGGSVYLQSEAASLSIGDTIDVSGAKATYLCEERGDFERAGEELEEATVSEDDIVDTLEEAEHTDAESSIEDGVCPWCGEEFGSVAPHASQVHEDEWAEYTED